MVGVSDHDKRGGGVEQTAPNACEPYAGDLHCEAEDGECGEIAEWRVQFHTGGCERFWRFACDNHVADFWGYHPEENGGAAGPEAVQSVEFSVAELEQVERALSNHLAPYVNPQIRGADVDDEGVAEMESALDTVRTTLQDRDMRDTEVER